MWPRGINAIRAMKELRHPDKKWECFELKNTSGSRTKCDEFDITTAEVSDEEGEDESEIAKRKQKKKTYDEFVTETCPIHLMVILCTEAEQLKDCKDTVRYRIICRHCSSYKQFYEMAQSQPLPPETTITHEHKMTEKGQELYDSHKIKYLKQIDVSWGTIENLLEEFSECSKELKPLRKLEKTHFEVS
ncbi:unnamed protein product [Mytilus coruscus]|uniref:Uncharacterized protein n=1 Tax=Mytilus coruscus TaxID=42192 RepID=A0A6J8DQW3_MYTCO|nr:unnamed protein product [Mytilus coruscus]